MCNFADQYGITSSNKSFFTTVLISVASALAKIAYPAARGWMAPFRKGLIQNVALWNYRVGVWHLLKAAAPLLLGTVLEYGEWELLTLFIRHLGPAEGEFFLRDGICTNNHATKFLIFFPTSSIFVF